MNVLRNTIAVIIGLFVSMVIIIIGITLNEEWIQYHNYDPYFPFERWQRVVKGASDWFFVALLISGGIASIIGGITTALIVNNAKVAYSMLIGLILFIIGIADNVLTSGHPTWYNISMFFVYFPASWIGGKIVEKITKKHS
ncbi:MAG: hypothetical protein H6604_08655 [Flavobacteriales bacterium]|nr:hypothetical protein [Flavobacteriales bacterium]